MRAFLRALIAKRNAPRPSIELSSSIRPFVRDSRSDDIAMRMNFKCKADSVVAVGGRIGVRGDSTRASAGRRCSPA